MVKPISLRLRWLIYFVLLLPIPVAGQHMQNEAYGMSDEALVSMLKDIYRSEQEPIRRRDSLGWPEKRVIGEEGYITLCIVLQHASPEIRVAYLPLMKAAVASENLHPRLLARAEDRIATDRGELQVYGGQMKYYPETQSFNVWPVFDPANIDKRRAAIGLGPVAEYLKERFDFEWDLEEQIERSLAFEAERGRIKN